jgi:hypothetical protein
MHPRQTCLRSYAGLSILWYFVQFVSHVSHPILGNPCNNFFLILADFGDLLEKLKSHVPYKLNEILQYRTYANPLEQHAT